MDIKLLKESIENGNIDNSFKIFILEEGNSRIIADQYIHLIAEKLELNVKLMNKYDLQEEEKNTSVLCHNLINLISDDPFEENDKLYVIEVDTWDSNETHDDCIVICNSTTCEGIAIPKLVDWQVIDYVLPKVKGLEKADVEWLLSNYSGNYQRFILDIEKLSVFDSALQRQMFLEMLEEGCFDSISSLTVFNLVDAIVKKDIKSIRAVLAVRNNIDLTPMHFLVILTNKMKQIINIQLNPGCTLAESGCKSDKQLWFYRKNICGQYSSKQLVEVYNMLTGIEHLFKYEELTMDNMIDYIIVKTLS